MGSNQAAIGRRQRERQRQQKAQEKLARKQERREQKKTGPGAPDDPQNDPSIDWGDAVREIKIEDAPAPDEAEAEP